MKSIFKTQKRIDTVSERHYNVSIRYTETNPQGGETVNEKEQALKIAEVIVKLDPAQKEYFRGYTDAVADQVAAKKKEETVVNG